MRRYPERPFKLERRLRRNRLLPVDDRTDHLPRPSYLLSKFALRKAAHFQLLRKEFTGWNGKVGL